MDIFFYKKEDGKIRRPSFFKEEGCFYQAKDVKNLTDAIVKMKNDTNDLTNIDFRLMKFSEKKEYNEIDFDMLKNTDFSGCLFENCNFLGDIENCDFRNAEIKKCKGTFFTFSSDFSESILQNNSFFSVNIFQTSFRNAIIDNNSFYHTSFEKMTPEQGQNIAISDFNMKSFKNNECENGGFASEKTLFQNNHKTFLEKYKYKISLLGFSLLTIPLPAALHHYDIISSSSQHMLNYGGYAMLGIASIKDKIKNSQNVILDDCEFYILNILKKIKNRIKKNTGKDYDSCIISVSENNKIKKILDDIKVDSSSVKMNNLDIVFLSPDTYCTVINILMNKKENDDKMTILINDDCNDGEISGFIKNQDEIFFIEKGRPDKIHSFSEKNSEYKILLNKAIQDFSKKYSQKIQKEFFEKYNGEFVFDKNSHVLLKSENTYYVLNTETLENTNGDKPSSITYREDNISWSDNEDEIIVTQNGISKYKMKESEFKKEIASLFENDIMPLNKKF